MKILLIIFCVSAFVLSCGLALRFNHAAADVQNELDGERFKRIVAEENLQKANTRIASLESETKKAQSQIESIKVVLEKTKLINDDLKTRLATVEDTKEALDTKIKELLQTASPF